MSYLAEYIEKNTKMGGWCRFTGSLQKQSHCHCFPPYVIATVRLSVCYLSFPLSCNAVTLKCEKGIKMMTKYSSYKSIPPFLLCLYHLPTPSWLAMTGMVVKVTALHSQCQEKQCVCIVVCRLTNQWFTMKKTKRSSSSSSQLCCLKAVPVTINLRDRLLTSECVCSSSTVQVRQCGFERIS